MGDIDDLPLTSGVAGDGPAEPPPARRLPVLLIAGLGLLVGAAGAWWWTRTPASPATAESPRTATDVGVAPATEPIRPLPPVGQMDIFLRALLGTLSASPELARWLATDDLIRQMAHAIDLVSRGQSPARQLTVLRPEGALRTSGPSRQLTLDPASYRRFDAVASAVASLDPKAVADAYRTIQPRLDEAYRGLGRSEVGVDAAVRAALQVLIDTPVVEDPIRLVPGAGATFAYADPRLQTAAPAQKQLIRMGPEHLARVTARLREIKAAIDLPPSP
jgi:Protein of unknown function (DUF3014)